MQDQVGKLIAVHNQNPKPFVWTKANDILQSHPRQPAAWFEEKRSATLGCSWGIRTILKNGGLCKSSPHFRPHRPRQMTGKPARH